MILDTIDLALLAAIKEKPGQAVYEVVTVLRGRGVPRSNHALRDRLRNLEDLGFVRLDRISQRRRVLCYLTDAGEKALAEA